MFFFSKDCLGKLTFKKHCLKHINASLGALKAGILKMYTFQDNHTFTFCFAIRLCTRSKFIRQLHTFGISTLTYKYILWVDLSLGFKFCENFKNANFFA